MKPMDKDDWIAVFVGQVIIQMIFLWEIDISVSAMTLQAVLHVPMEASNGLFGINPSITYHIGLYGTIANLFFMALFGIHHVLKEE